MDSEDELERQRRRADRVQAALDAVRPEDLQTLLDEELVPMIAALARVLAAAQAELTSRG